VITIGEVEGGGRGLNVLSPFNDWLTKLHSSNNLGRD